VALQYSGPCLQHFGSLHPIPRNFILYASHDLRLFAQKFENAAEVDSDAENAAVASSSLQFAL
jgi:hypothetical protein